MVDSTIEVVLSLEKNEGEVDNIALIIVIVALIFNGVAFFLDGVALIFNGITIRFIESEGNAGEVDGLRGKIALTFTRAKEAMMPAEDYIPRGDFEFQA